MVSVATTDFVRTIRTDDPPFSLIEQHSLLSRLVQAVESAIAELASDPRAFMRGLLSADTKDEKRRRRIYLGLVCAVVVHVALLTTIAVIGWRTASGKQISDEASSPKVTILKFPTIEKNDANKPDMPKGSDAGGGGGGQHALLPPSRGERPPMLPVPQIVSPNPSNIPEPTLAFTPTVVGPTTAPPPPGPTGVPAGKSADFSAGPGNGGGLGGGDGTGVGNGKDGGAGPGGRGGRGGELAGSPDGVRTDIPPAVDFNRLPPGYRPWTWIRRPTPEITREAQENKVTGTVVLRANFNADGTITNIQVAMPVDFMNDSAIEALRRSTFHPATMKGVPVTVRNVLIKVDVHN